MMGPVSTSEVAIAAVPVPADSVLLFLAHFLVIAVLFECLLKFSCNDCVLYGNLV
jgi:hypothetical protein